MDPNLFFRQQIIDNCHLLFPNDPCIRVITSTAGDYVISDGEIPKILLDCPPNTSNEPELSGLYQKTRQRVTERIADMKIVVREIRRNSCQSSGSSSGGSSPLTRSLDSVIPSPADRYKRNPVYKLQTLPVTGPAAPASPETQVKIASRRMNREISKEMMLKMSASVTQDIENMRRQELGQPSLSTIDVVGVTARWVASRTSSSESQVIQKTPSDIEERGRRRERDPPPYCETPNSLQHRQTQKGAVSHTLKTPQKEPSLFLADEEGFDMIEHPSL
ncbi:hypothetical protein EDC01DRAFT_667700 [Geopyxis carbonaria]|nr:hypothetical protein EDC01DRAFT_667700 [Geopyxis carbonaria]